MTIEVIDIGTNSIRCDIRKPPYGEEDLLFRDKEVIRLGRSVFDTGLIDEEAISLLFAALGRYIEQARGLNVERTLVFATSAMREASNGLVICREIHEKFGTAVKLISGDREAQLIATGVLSAEKKLAENSVLFDIGGGSTEFCLCRAGKLIAARSLPIGSLRLQQTKLHKPKPEKSDLIRAREFVRQKLETLGSLHSDINFRYENASLIGSSGTAKAILRLYPDRNLEPDLIPREKIGELLEELSELSLEQMLKLPGIEPKRVEILLAGTLLLKEIVDYFDAPSIRITEFSLRDGVFEEIRLGLL